LFDVREVRIITLCHPRQFPVACHRQCFKGVEGDEITAKVKGYDTVQKI
jgi:hypothetical protein